MRLYWLLALLARATTEWVEISQQHYRKPNLRPAHRHPAISDDKSTEVYLDYDRNRIYLNQSLDSYRNKGVIRRVPSIGSIERVVVRSTERPRATTVMIQPEVTEATTRTSLMKYGFKRYDLKEVTDEPPFVTKSKFIVEQSDTPIVEFVQTVKSINKDSDDVNTRPVLDRPEFSENEFMETSIVHNPDNTTTKTPTVEHIEPEDLVNNTKANPMENVARFMRIVADTISKNTRRSLNSKVKYLRELKYTILANIEERIDSMWPDDISGHRRSRAAHVARGHVEFPSSEGALMTISFLTFAVFLIKLILQVIHTYKNKTMMVAPTVVAVGRRAADALHRHHRFNN